MTTRGFKQTEAKLIANWICDILDDCESEEKIGKVKQKVLELCSDFLFTDKKLIEEYSR